ncbi:MAG TPA: SCP2 sterol-binding domain-containing protein [Methylophilaceae bacterium]|nr:SCP2 sterol-binding domain-containing protein [Methylophilaceae bacterium]
MFKTIASQFLQHLTNQNSWSRKYLLPFAGKVLQFNILPIKTKLIILEDGSLGIPPDHATSDAIIHIPPSLAIRLMANDESAKMEIRIDGDSHLATEVTKVLQYVRWDVEDDLSKVVGDISSNKVVTMAKESAQAVKNQATNLTEMLIEFWQEEKPILAKQWQVNQFNTDVDSLHSDMNRLEKRLNKLKKSIEESSAD